MKQKLIKIICFFFALTILSCEVQEDLSQSNKTEMKIKKISIKDIMNKPEYMRVRKPISDLKEKATKKNNQNTQTKLVYNEQYGMYIDDENGVFIENDGTQSYTFRIKRTETEEKLENIVFKSNSDGGFETLIVKYDITYDEIEALGKEEIRNREIQYTTYNYDNQTENIPSLVCAQTWEFVQYYPDEGELTGVTIDNFFHWVLTAESCSWVGGGPWSSAGLGNGSGTGVGGSTSGGINGGGGTSGPIITTPIIEEKTPCKVLKNKSNDPIYKAKFLALNNPTNFGALNEIGFVETKTEGVSSYPNAIPNSDNHSMDVPGNAINFTHVHNNKPLIDPDGNQYDGAVKILSPRDISSIYNICVPSAIAAGGSPLDSFATMISNEGIFSINIIDPNFGYEAGDFNGKYKKFERKYYKKVEEIILNFNLSTLQRKEKMQKMLLGLINEYGLQNSIGLYEGEVISVGTTQNIKWKNKSLDNSGNLIETTCP